MDLKSGYRRRKSSPIFGGLVNLFVLCYIMLPVLSMPSTPLNSQSLLQPTRKSPRQNVAAIIEDRPLTNLAPLLLHFSAVLGPAWPVILFTAQKHDAPKPAPLSRAIADGRISIWYLPSNARIKESSDISEFLTQPWLWEMLAPAGHVLLFDVDSIICANSPLYVENFLHYDFVGAPIDPSLGKGEGYNGGLSLRNRSMVLDIVNRASWSNEMRNRESGGVDFEDRWLLKKMKELYVHPDGQLAASLPSIDVAKSFAVEIMWYDTPLGYHHPGRWEKEKMDKVDQWCPEHRISTIKPALIDHSFNPTELKRRYRTSSSILEML